MIKSSCAVLGSTISFTLKKNQTIPGGHCFGGMQMIILVSATYGSQLSANGHSRERTALLTDTFYLRTFLSPSQTLYLQITISGHPLGERTRTLMTVKFGFFSLRSARIAWLPYDRFDRPQNVGRSGRSYGNTVVGDSGDRDDRSDCHRKDRPGSISDDPGHRTPFNGNYPGRSQSTVGRSVGESEVP